jgi:hypothetical protein
MESNFPVARFLDMPRRIAQERVPTASNVGSRDVTWASQPHPSSPSRLFSSFAGQLRKEKKGSHGGHGGDVSAYRRVGVWASCSG